MRRLVTQTLVWLVVVSLFATPPAFVSGLNFSGSSNIAATGDLAGASAAAAEKQNQNRTIAGQANLAYFYYERTIAEEAVDSIEQSTALAPYVATSPSVHASAARRLLDLVCRDDRSVPVPPRHLRL
ncbi:hypothetical protein [Blastopirellula retiformator]|uniref:Uncharacterized protein n=1 Tax=Blastopirellula retiformator TaxID=2527970 RepID=A0A5C5VMG3_9BACT|nr:hypothetical protein [Blastopirellula retiformator]TWT39081.1 hypothetical protein Enr8_07760 [Blastopirellula retiformator]